MMFMKVYGTEAVMASKIGVDEKTYRGHAWPVVKAIASMKTKVVSAKVCYNVLLLVSF